MRLSKEELQLAVGYVIYMQMASYFEERPVCENRNMERKLAMLYKLMPTKKQYWIEDICDRYILKELKDIPKEMLSLRAECIFESVMSEKGKKVMIVTFSTWKYDLSICGMYDEHNNLIFNMCLEKYEIEKLDLNMKIVA